MNSENDLWIQKSADEKNNTDEVIFYEQMNHISVYKKDLFESQNYIVLGA